MKKTLPLVTVAFVAALSLSGCGAPSNADTSSPSQSSSDGATSGSTTGSGNNSTPSGSKNTGSTNGSSESATTGNSSSGSTDAGQGQSSTSGATQGSNGDSNSGSDGSGPATVTDKTKDASGAVASLQGFLNALDKDVDATYKGAESSDATAAGEYASLKVQLPSAVKYLDENSLSASKSVTLLKVYAKNMKAVKKGVAITVNPDGITVNSNGSVEITSSSIFVAYDGKPRSADKAGKDKFVLTLNGGKWEISDAVITSPTP